MDEESDIIPFPTMLDRLRIMDRGVRIRHAAVSVDRLVQAAIVSNEAGLRLQSLVCLLDDETSPVI